MKIVICNVPLRSAESKTTYPPFGVLAVMQSLRSADYSSDFYDINFFRPSHDEIRNYFLKNKYDIIGISATVSTSYGAVKRLVAIIRGVLPDSIIVVGGAITASSEIILKFSDVDYCVVGEGERVIVNLVKYAASYGKERNEEALKCIKGLAFLNKNGDAVFTGYEEQLSADSIQDADYKLIEKYSSTGHYITDPFVYEQFGHDKRSLEDRRSGKRLAVVVSSRGCVNRCAFCYRWQKGIRIFPVDRVIAHVRMLIKDYNVGFISFGDEDFGASAKWLDEFIEKIRPLNILYRISGICCDNVTLDVLKRLKDSGCVAVHYGFESGSDRILRVMEKRSNAATNIDIAFKTYTAGLQTVPALVVGMPGESYDTIEETADFVNRITEFLPHEPVISTNALVVLPGTPVYEYARYKKFLGDTPADEERYLLRISDRGGSSMRQLNLTDYPYFIVQGWIRCISISARYNYYKKNGRPKYSDAAKGAASLYGSPIVYRLRYFISPLLVMYKNYREDKALFMKRCGELAAWPFRRRTFADYIPLRDFLKQRAGNHAGSDSVRALRLGR